MYKKILNNSWLIFNKYYWAICLLSCSVLIYIVYGFVANLYFWRDNYALMYRLQQGWLFDFPYQGWSISYYPIFFFFKNSPAAYFITSLIVYLLLCLVTAYFVNYMTKDKLLGFISGLILSSGYVGAEMMFMSSVSVFSIIYIILSILILIMYKNYLDNRSLKVYFYVWITFFITVFYSPKELILYPVIISLWFYYPEPKR